MVGVKGLEPSTSASQTRRASQLRHTPWLLVDSTRRKDKIIVWQCIELAFGIMRERL